MIEYDDPCPFHGVPRCERCRCPACHLGVMLEDKLGWYCSRRYAEKPCLFDIADAEKVSEALSRMICSNPKSEVQSPKSIVREAEPMKKVHDAADVRRIGHQLSKELYELNAGLRAVEEFLATSRVAVEADVDLSTEGEPVLWFGKHQGKWGLYVDLGGDEGLVPLVSSPKRVRLAAIDALPALVDKILGEAQAQIVDSMRAKEKVGEVLASLGMSPLDVMRSCAVGDEEEESP